MPGHVFLVHGDLTQLACDAWLVPSGSYPRPGSIWQHAVSPIPPPGNPDHWARAPGRIVPWEPKEAGWPRPWVVLTAHWAEATADQFVEPAKQFLATAAASPGPPRGGRALPLLALPVVGAGHAGGAPQAGQIVRALLPALYDFTRANPIDVALVMKEPAQYAAAQAVRSELDVRVAWPELPDALIATADGLAYRASRQELVLFLGAGVSQSAGLPSWDGLLERLAGKDLAADPDFRQLGALDQARVVQRRLPTGYSLGEAVAAALPCQHYSLAHGLLASLPVLEVVTTNYDSLFEAASRAIDRPVDVLPYELTGGGRRWLLKLHGCTSRPGDIVLTREDYLRFDAGRAALAGLVQGLLLTRHMLFVGFSLADDNFHRIADAVRRVVKKGPFGTSLSVAGNRQLREIWSENLDWVELGDLPGSARLLEIFLDRLAARTVATADHLFDPKYAAILSPAEVRLRDELARLWDFVAAIPPEERKAAAWVEVERLLARLGRGMARVPRRSREETEEA